MVASPSSELQIFFRHPRAQRVWLATMEMGRWGGRVGGGGGGGIGDGGGEAAGQGGARQCGENCTFRYQLLPTDCCPQECRSGRMESHAIGCCINMYCLLRWDHTGPDGAVRSNFVTHHLTSACTYARMYAHTHTHTHTHTHSLRAHTHT